MNKKNLKILIVDDEKVSRTILINQLISLGISDLTIVNLQEKWNNRLFLRPNTLKLTEKLVVFFSSHKSQSLFF